MNRYEGITGLIVYPEIESSEDDIIVDNKANTRYDKLAHEHYGDVTLWWILARANGDDTLIPTPLLIRIPRDARSIIERFNTLNK